MYSGVYVAPTLTVDSVVFQLDDDQLNVLLVQRAAEPFQGWWALPGGYNSAGETTTEAMSRILEAKAGVAVKQLRLVEQLYTFDTVARDPRGHAVSVTYMGLGRHVQPVPSKTTQNPRFFPIGALPKLAYDHEYIVHYARERLQAKLGYTNAIFALLPIRFTLSQLQRAYEIVLDRPLDKRNFRKKIASLDLVEATEEMHQEGAHRPARLYVFRHPDMQILGRNFD